MQDGTHLNDIGTKKYARSTRGSLVNSKSILSGNLNNTITFFPVPATRLPSKHSQTTGLPVIFYNNLVLFYILFSIVITFGFQLPVVAGAAFVVLDQPRAILIQQFCCHSLYNSWVPLPSVAFASLGAPLSAFGQFWFTISLFTRYIYMYILIL